jgi:hypothetical protein
MSWEKWEKAVERGPMSLVWRVVACVVLLIVVLGVIGFVMDPFRQAARIVDKTIDADNVIYNYEWFKQRYEDVHAIDAKILDAEASVAAFAEAAGARTDWHREDREEHARLSAVALGLKQQRADLAAEYNARSRMANRAIFKAGDVELPESIPVRQGE